jgi:EXS family
MHEFCRSYYYFAIVEDLFLRFPWVYILLMNEAGLAEYNEGIVSVFACLEVIRRFV